MSDYLGPLEFGTSGTYRLVRWNVSAAESGLSAAMQVDVHGATTAALTAAIEALVAQLKVGNTYVHYFPAATNPVVYQVIGVSPVDLDENLGTVYRTETKFTLSLAAMPAGALTTLYSAQAVSSPASLALDTLLGTHPPQLDVTIDDNSGNDLHCVLAALAPTALSDSMWLVKASALTWTTMTSTTDAAAWVDNTVRTTTSSSLQTAPLDTASYPQQKARLWVRAKVSAGEGRIKDSQNDTEIVLTNTTFALHLVGDLDLPVRDTASGTAANLTLSVKSDGANTLTVDAFVLQPLSWGSFSWHHETPSGECDQLDVGPSGCFVDGVADATYFKPRVLTPRVLAAHVGTLVATASPSGSSWPTDWDKTASGVSADTSRFKLVGASKEAWYAATNAATPIVVPGAWYELSFTRDVDSYVAGAVTAGIVWQDVDGNTVRSDTLSSVAANDAAPTAVTVYGHAPVHAARARVLLATSGAGNVTAYFSAVVLRRCPLRLILVAEDSAGTVSSYRHALLATVRYLPRYEVAR